jgi:hypothetical protein
VTVTFKAAPLVAGKPNATVSDVAQSLTQRLVQAGYPQPKYLGVGCNGVAVAANFEAILNSGKRKPGLNGFPASSEEAAPGLPGAVDFLIGLFYAPPGYYRRVLFVVTDAAPPTTSGEATDEELRNLVSGGSTYLPLAYRAAPLNSSHQIIAWIYEFKLEPGSDKAEQVAASGSPAKGLLTALGHLRAAGIFQQIPQ